MQKKEFKHFLLQLDNDSPIPIYEQIKQAVKLAVLSGELREGDQLPPIRDLAAMLRVNPNTIVKVYYQLETEGYLKAIMGSGIFVRFDPQKIAPDTKLLFSRVTDEYIAKASKLGYTLQQMARELSRRGLGKEGKKENQGDQP